MAECFDVVVIGSGPGGYYAAIKAAQKKATVAVIEKDLMGGTCLNRGCIPSKALLASAEVLLQARSAAAVGVDIPSASPNWPKMQQRKDAIVAGFRKGLTGLMQANKVKVFTGRGVVKSANKVAVLTNAGDVEIEVRKGIILATGSEPVSIPAFPYDGQTILSSTEALSLSAIPASMVVVGGGIIGCELACVYAAVGTKVTIVEALERIINTEDKWVSQLMERELKKLGIDIMTARKVTGVDTSAGTAKVSLDGGQMIEAEKVLVSVGRRAVCDKETVDALGLQMKGKVIAVSDTMQTSVPGVYAIGDAVGTTYLAHGAFAEAEVAVENLLGGNAKMYDYSLVPRAVYTFPEIASVGKGEDKCSQLGIDVVIGRGFFKANGRSVAHNETIGEIRIVRDKAGGKILGVTMVGAGVTELIAGARLLIGSTEKFEDVSFPHPTVSEVLKESWEDSFGASVHQPPRVG